MVGNKDKRQDVWYIVDLVAFVHGRFGFYLILDWSWSRHKGFVHDILVSGFEVVTFDFFESSTSTKLVLPSNGKGRHVGYLAQSDIVGWQYILTATMISLLLISGSSLEPPQLCHMLVIHAICCNGHDNVHKFWGTLPVQMTRWDLMGIQ